MPAVGLIDRFTDLDDIPFGEGVLRRVGNVIDWLPEDYYAQSTDFVSEVVNRITGDNLESAARIASDALLTPSAGVYASSTTVAQSSKVTGDANLRWQRAANGTISWGDGTNAADITLSRPSASELRSNGTGFSIASGAMYFAGGAGAFRSTNQAAITNTFLATKLIADSLSRFEADTSGKISWGSGALAADTNLYRSAAGVVRTDGQIWAGSSTLGFRYIPSTASGTAFSSQVSTEAASRFKFDYLGFLQWGDGTNVPDVSLKRNGAAELDLNGRLHLYRTVGTVLSTNTVATGTSRFSINTDGRFDWGDGTNAVDTNLYRSAADTLKTDDAFLASSVQAYGASGMIISSGGLTLSGSSSAIVARSASGSGISTFVSRVSTDTVDRFTLSADGKHSWSSGALASDTTLYRANADLLRTDDEFNSLRSSTSLKAFSVNINGENAARLSIRADGKHEWGDGTNTADILMFRGAASELWVDGSRIQVRRATNGSALGAWVTGDSQSRFILNTDGSMSWGTGALATDVNMQRVAGNFLQINGGLTVAKAGALTGAFNVTQSGDAISRYSVRNDGKVTWGDGTNSQDTNLYRSGIGIIRTDGVFLVGDFHTMSASGYHGFLEIADPAAAAVNQARLYARDNGAGKTQLCVRFPTGAVQVIATEP
jgi:hypothetical protein